MRCDFFTYTRVSCGFRFGTQFAAAAILTEPRPTNKHAMCLERILRCLVKSPTLQRRQNRRWLFVPQRRGMKRESVHQKETCKVVGTGFTVVVKVPARDDVSLTHLLLTGARALWHSPSRHPLHSHHPLQNSLGGNRCTCRKN